MDRSRVVLLVVALGALTPAVASADWFIGAGIGTARGGSLDESKRSFSVSLGAIGVDSVVGFEGDFGFTEDIREGVNMRTAGGNFIVGPNLVENRLRPYGTIGFGAISWGGPLREAFKFETTPDPVLSFGGGVMATVASHLGVRLDIRRFRDTKKDEFAVPENFTFTRVTIGAHVIF